jgi:dTDP-4-amino-4,6-dideoxygalactose transaminase
LPSLIGSNASRAPPVLARPVFADVREDTLNLDEGGLADLISERTGRACAKS